MTVAINKLRGELETHPLIPQLHDRIATLEEANERQVQNLTAMETTLIPRAIKMGAEEERKRCDKVIAAIEKERDLMQRDLQKEQVAKSNFRRAMKEREDVLRDEIEKAQRWVLSGNSSDPPVRRSGNVKTTPRSRRSFMRGQS